MQTRNRSAVGPAMLLAAGGLLLALAGCKGNKNGTATISRGGALNRRVELVRN